MFLWLADWWDGVDLWLSQLAFPFQFAIVIAVLAPVCFGIAVLVDRVVDLVSARSRRGPDEPTNAESAVESDAEADAESAAEPGGPPVTATAGRGSAASGS